MASFKTGWIFRDIDDQFRVDLARLSGESVAALVKDYSGQKTWIDGKVACLDWLFLYLASLFVTI